MLQLARWRVILVAVVTAMGIAFAFPNFVPEQMRDQIPNFLPKQAINLGLDLRGGSQLLLEIDTATMQHQQLDNIADQMASALREADPQIRYTGRGVVGDAARIRLIDPTQMEAARRVLRPLGQSTTTGNDIIEFTESADGLIEARITPAHLRELSRQAAQQSIEVIRRRIDPTGTSEVTIVRQGDDRIIVQAPGVSDPEMLKARIGQTALMTFHMVRNVPPEDAAAGRTPIGAMVVQPYPDSGGSSEVVERRPRFTGERLVRANPSTDPQTGEFVLSFALDSEGTRLFCRITRQYTGERFAILLDNQVLTAPRINEPICGGTGQISGNFTAESANNLAVMLRAGALPAPLSVIDERTVDASLGRDAIESGARASAVAGVVTFLFMLLAYGLFGIFACLALVVNFILIMAAMSTIGAALTLPGIAGLILTVAMAVDANVLIYERMREEAAAGRGPALAIDAGFNRAMITIIDANLTTILAAAILFQFGAGPVRGFAWTLSIGVVTSVFAAVLVTQILIAWWFRAARPKTLPI
ncbi:MAG: preprotein translocase subunit SecD [Proteobacteria bacterium HN_bin10]|jgi:protein-export membrane protein SecD|nr:MAG: preprotein translocase subunit SecD [Proteobacteria bacterium HN_bin10]